MASSGEWLVARKASDRRYETAGVFRPAVKGRSKQRPYKTEEPNLPPRRKERIYERRSWVKGVF